MINVDANFKNGAVADSRRVYVKALISITPEDPHFGAITGSAQSLHSKSDQIYDEIDTLGKPAISYELNRWVIGQDFKVYTNRLNEEASYESNATFDGNGNSSGLWVQLEFSNVPILQGFSIYFPEDNVNGYPVNFTVQLKQNSTIMYERTVTNNRESKMFFSGFTAHYPTAIRITVTKWSLPYRRLRIPEITLGLRDEWSDDRFSSLTIRQKSDFTAFTVPYSTCEIEIDNSDLLFDPTNKDGLFASIEERQPIQIFMAINNSEWYKIGTYFQYSKGWRTGNNSLTLRWNLVDIIGLLVDRKYDTRVTPTQPTTLGGWVAALVAQLGLRFAEMYEVPASLANISLTCSASKLVDRTCGEILKWICQATHTWARASSEGNLYVGRFDRYSQDATTNLFKLDYDNLSGYPSISGNEDIASFDFDIQGADYSIGGNSPSSPNTQSIDNPFIVSTTAAHDFVTYELQYYGGNLIAASGRGFPMLEVGDIVNVESTNGAYLPARIVEQDFIIQNHIMSACGIGLMQIGSITNYTSYVVITQDSVWNVPGNIAVENGVGSIRVVLVQAGSSGGHGDWQWEDMSGPGGSWVWHDGDEDGENGPGGRIRVVELSVTPSQPLSITIGRAAEPHSLYRTDPLDGRRYLDYDTSATEGGHSIMTINGTPYSSYEGTIYQNGWIEPISQKSLGHTGYWHPVANSGDGGHGGERGRAETDTEFATDPSLGVKGADGCVIICYSIAEV